MKLIFREEVVKIFKVRSFISIQPHVVKLEVLLNAHKADAFIELLFDIEQEQTVFVILFWQR